MLGEIIQGVGQLGSAAINSATTAAVAAADRKFNAQQAQLNRDFNSSEAQKQRDYNTEMSNTAYQRAVQDMEAAGLNPALAYSQGGASFSGGSAASASGMAQAPQRSYAQTAQAVANAFHSIGNAFIQKAESQQAVNSAKEALRIVREARDEKLDDFNRVWSLLNRNL